MAPKASTSASSFTPTLPTRQVPARSASTKAKQKIEASLHLCKFTALPTELLDMIKDQIRTKKDVRALAMTCKLFWIKWGLPDHWPLDTWTGGLASRVPIHVPLFRMAKHKKGNSPFYVENARREPSGKVVLSIIGVASEHLDRKWGRVYLDCYQWGQRLHTDLGGYGNGVRVDQVDLDWEEDRRKMVSATSDWLAANFPCPICKDKGEVFAGSKKVLQRWPAMKYYDGKKRRVIDCPGCARDYSNNDDRDDGGEGLLAYLRPDDVDDANSLYSSDF